MQRLFKQRFRGKPNPHYQRLMQGRRRFYCAWSGGQRIAFALIFLLFLLTLSGVQVTGIFAGLVLLASLPTVLGATAALFTARDATTAEYEMLTLTDLTDRQLFMGYWRASLDRFAYGIGLPLLAIITIMVGSGWLYILSGLHTDYDQGNLWTYAALLWLVAMLGLAWLCHACGVWAGLAFRQPGSVMLTMIGFGGVITVLWAGFMIFQVVTFVPDIWGAESAILSQSESFPADDVYEATLIGLMPYVMTLVVLINGPQFARRD